MKKMVIVLIILIIVIFGAVGYGVWMMMQEDEVGEEEIVDDVLREDVLALLSRSVGRLNVHEITESDSGIIRDFRREGGITAIIEDIDEEFTFIWADTQTEEQVFLRQNEEESYILRSVQGNLFEEDSEVFNCYAEIIYDLLVRENYNTIEELVGENSDYKVVEITKTNLLSREIVIEVLEINRRTGEIARVETICGRSGDFISSMERTTNSLTEQDMDLQEILINELQINFGEFDFISVDDEEDETRENIEEVLQDIAELAAEQAIIAFNDPRIEDVTDAQSVANVIIEEAQSIEIIEPRVAAGANEVVALVYIETNDAQEDENNYRIVIEITVVEGRLNIDIGNVEVIGELL